MISCLLKYEIDPAKLDDFKKYAEGWIVQVNRLGGQHLGYFLPSEGDSDIAYATFNFPSLAEYETYRQRSFQDAECLALFAMAQDIGCVKRYERTFLDYLNPQ